MMLEGQTFQKVECEKKTNFNKRKIKKSTCTTSQKNAEKTTGSKGRPYLSSRATFLGQ